MRKAVGIELGTGTVGGSGAVVAVAERDDLRLGSGIEDRPDGGRGDDDVAIAHWGAYRGGPLAAAPPDEGIKGIEKERLRRGPCPKAQAALGDPSGVSCRSMRGRSGRTAS